MVARLPVLLTVCFLVAVSVAGFSSASASAAEPGVVDEAVTFSIPDVWPWAYTDANGKPQGSLIEVTRQLSERTGIPIIAQLRPLRRAIVELRSGVVNFSLLFQSPELDVDAINVSPITQVNILLVAMAGSDYPLTLEALKGERVAFISGTYLGEAFKADTGVKKVPVSSISQAVNLLYLGRISAILASDHNIYRTLSSLNMKRDVLRYTKHVSGQIGTIYMSRVAERPEVARQFRRVITQMAAGGELRRIFYGDATNADLPDNATSSQ